MDLECWTGRGPATLARDARAGDADCTYELAANSQRWRSARDAEDERVATRRRSKGEGEKVASRRIDQRDELPSGRRRTIANRRRRETQCSTDPTTAGRIGTGYEMPRHATPTATDPRRVDASQRLERSVRERGDRAWSMESGEETGGGRAKRGEAGGRSRLARATPWPFD